VTIALLTGGRSSVNKVVALAFAGHATRPSLAVKMPRVPESIAGLEREAATLAALQRRTSPVPGIPRLLFREGGGSERSESSESVEGREEGDEFTDPGEAGRRVLRVAESIVEGRRLEEALTPATVADLARRVTRWQIELAGDPPDWDPDELRRSVLGPAITGFEATFGPVIDPLMLRDAADRIESIGTLPVVCEQRDFSPWNVLVDPEGGIAVLDWESSRLEGVPATDLVYFLAYAAVVLRGAFASGDYGAAYRDLRHTGTTVGVAATDCLARYSDALGLDDAQLRALRILTWMLHAPSVHAHLTAAAGGHPPAPEQLGTSEFLRFWEIEMTDDG
jgi:hypothetical protein